MATGRWHIELAEENDPPALVLRRPQPDSPDEDAVLQAPNLLPLLSALRHLAFRAGEPGAWGAPLARDPIAFLLDSITEAVNVRTTSGEIVYSNRVGADFGPLGHARIGGAELVVHGHRFEGNGAAYVVEIFREIRKG